MHYGASAYSKVAQTTQSPRELEATILMKAATRLQAIRDDWNGRAKELDEALTYNRKLWTVLATSATAAENPLPKQIKENIGNISLFVLPHCVELEQQPDPQRMASLVNINRELAAGLMQRANAA